MTEYKMGQVFSQLNCLLASIRECLGDTLTTTLGLGACALILFFNRDVVDSAVQFFCCFRLLYITLIRILALLLLLALMLYLSFASPIICMDSCASVDQLRSVPVPAAKTTNRNECLPEESEIQCRDQGMMTNGNDECDDSEIPVEKIYSRISKLCQNQNVRSTETPAFEEDRDCKKNLNDNDFSNDQCGRLNQDHGICCGQNVPRILLLDYNPPQCDICGSQGVRCRCLSESPRVILLDSLPVSSCFSPTNGNQPNRNHQRQNHNNTKCSPGLPAHPRSRNCFESESTRRSRNGECEQFPQYPSVEHDVNKQIFRNQTLGATRTGDDCVDSWFYKKYCTNNHSGRDGAAVAGRRNPGLESTEAATSTNVKVDAAVQELPGGEINPINPSSNNSDTRTLKVSKAGSNINANDRKSVDGTSTKSDKRL